MNAAQIISKKRDGGELTDGEIGDLIASYVAGTTPDYQMAAWAMAVFLRDMTIAEIASLTHHMLQSGVVFEWPHKTVPTADKHSTGGIGDKVSLPLAAMLACCGVCVPMISGRGLGATGGTLDKLESIPGYRTALSIEETQRIADDVGCVICSASEQLVPADRKLYALRDVTGTVPSVPLITASIMSKKLAEGLDALVLDVKQGTGAFMKSPADAERLAHSLVNTGQQMGVATSALITDMDQPLGRMIGNAVEVDESVDCLQGEGPADLRELTIELCAEALVSANAATDLASARVQLAETLDSGQAFEKFREMVAAQGGDLEAKRPRAANQELLATQSGYITAIDTEQIGWAVIEMGGGRKQLGDPVDHSVGLEILVRLGDQVEAGQPLANLFVHSSESQQAEQMVRGAVTVGDSEPPASLLIRKRIAAD